MATGYCTVEDVRRALRKSGLPGDIGQDRDIAIDAIVAQTTWLEKTIERHFYVPGGIDEDTDNLIPTSANTRDDEHDIPTHAGFVHGASEDRHRLRANSDALLEAGPRHHHRREAYRHPKREIKLAFGDSYALVPPVDETVPAYTRITLERKDVSAVNVLSVVNEDGAYDDWVADSSFDGGVGNANRGKDYWVRINNEGVSELYLDVHSMDDDIPSFSNAVYVDIDFGYEASADDPKLRTLRRAVANRAASDLVEEAVTGVPENVTLYNPETKAEKLERKAEELLEVYRRGT